MQPKSYQHTKTVAYNLANQISTLSGTNAELHMRNACNAGRSYVEARSFSSNLLWAIAFSYGPVTLIVMPICLFLGLGLLSALSWTGILGLILFVAVYINIVFGEKDCIKLQNTTNSCIAAMNTLKEKDREEVYQFLRQQDVAKQQRQNAYY